MTVQGQGPATPINKEDSTTLKTAKLTKALIEAYITFSDDASATNAKKLNDARLAAELLLEEARTSCSDITRV